MKGCCNFIANLCGSHQNTEDAESATDDHAAETVRLIPRSSGDAEVSASSARNQSKAWYTRLSSFLRADEPDSSVLASGRAQAIRAAGMTTSDDGLDIWNKAAFEQDFPKRLVDHWMFGENHEYGNEADLHDRPNYTRELLNAFKGNGYIDPDAHIAAEGAFHQMKQKTNHEYSIEMKARGEVPAELFGYYLNQRSFRGTGDDFEGTLIKNLVKPFLSKDERHTMNKMRGFSEGIECWATKDKQNQVTGASWVGADHLLEDCKDTTNKNGIGYPDDYSLLQKMNASGIHAAAVVPFMSANSYDEDDHGNTNEEIPDGESWKHFVAAQSESGRNVKFYSLTNQHEDGFFVVTPKNWNPNPI